MTFPFLCVLGLLVLLLLPGIYALFLPSDASIFLPDYKKSGVPPVFIAFQFNYPQALALGISRRLHVLPEWLTYVVGCTRTPLSPPRYNSRCSRVGWVTSENRLAAVSGNGQASPVARR